MEDKTAYLITYGFDGKRPAKRVVINKESLEDSVGEIIRDQLDKTIKAMGLDYTANQFLCGIEKCDAGEKRSKDGIFYFHTYDLIEVCARITTKQNAWYLDVAEIPVLDNKEPKREHYCYALATSKGIGKEPIAVVWGSPVTLKTDKTYIAHGIRYSKKTAGVVVYQENDQKVWKAVETCSVPRSCKYPETITLGRITHDEGKMPFLIINSDTL